ncbi:MAG: hypothetical protein AAGI46_16290 [Planctomycetota bacterium]
MPATPENTANNTKSSEASAPEMLVPPDRVAHVERDVARYASHVPSSVRHIDWGEIFPATKLFRGFRVAVHPSKLLLSLVAALLIYGGTRGLDGLFGLLPQAWRAVPGEPALFESVRSGGGDFDEEVESARRALERRRNNLRESAALVVERPVDEIGRGDLVEAAEKRRDERLSNLASARDRVLESADVDEASIASAERAYGIGVADTYALAAREVERVEDLYPRGVGITLYDYETQQLDRLVAAVLDVNFMGEGGVFASLYRGLWIGPMWAFSQHPLYAALLGIWTLAVLAVFGGAVARSAAVQVARDEKISLRSALRFSSGKFVSFLSAPLIPVLVIVVLGLTASLAALLMSLIGLVPGLGWLADIGIGLLVPIGLIVGLLITLTFIGLVGGISLMYPTIAVEGTDSFDAISRSFSYLFAKPWRVAWYGLVALVYGVLTFLVVRLFLWMVLIATRAALGVFVFREAAGTNVLDALWPKPSPNQFSYDIPFSNLTWGQDIAAVLIAITVFGLLSLLCAYALSLYVSMGTIIYYLLRREVDATEPDEVYLDPADEEFAGLADVADDPLAEPEPAEVASKESDE